MTEPKPRKLHRYRSLTLPGIPESPHPNLDALNACRADCHKIIDLAIDLYAAPVAKEQLYPGTTAECLDAIRCCIRSLHDALHTPNPPLSYRNFAGPPFTPYHPPTRGA